MRILVVDDIPSKYARLIKSLEYLGIKRSQLDFAKSASEGRDKLEATHYDILILDVLIPGQPEEESDRRHSLDLMFSIINDDTLHSPGRIIGITSDPEIAEQVRPEFGDHAWVVVNYSDSDDEWVNIITHCVTYAQRLDKKLDRSVHQPIDLVIICALAKPELSEILKLPWNWSSPRPLDELTFIRDGYVIVDGHRITVCATYAARMGMVSTALLSSKLISALKPKLLVMCGICAGVRTKVEVGDVLLADPAWDYQSGKRVKDGLGNTQFSIAPHQLPAPAIIRAHIEQIRDDEALVAEMNKGFEGAPNEFSIKIGPVASGSAVLADGEVVNQIKDQQRDLLGIEMEVYGMYAAGHNACHPQPKTFALKSVCDFADPDKGDDAQRFAAYSSARTLQALIETFGTRLMS